MSFARISKIFIFKCKRKIIRFLSGKVQNFNCIRYQNVLNWVLKNLFQQVSFAIGNEKPESWKQMFYFLFISFLLYLSTSTVQFFVFIELPTGLQKRLKECHVNLFHCHLYVQVAMFWSMSCANETQRLRDNIHGHVTDYKNTEWVLIVKTCQTAPARTNIQWWWCVAHGVMASFHVAEQI